MNSGRHNILALLLTSVSNVDMTHTAGGGAVHSVDTDGNFPLTDLPYVSDVMISSMTIQPM